MGRDLGADRGPLSPRNRCSIEGPGVAWELVSKKKCKGKTHQTIAITHPSSGGDGAAQGGAHGGAHGGLHDEEEAG